MSTDFIYLYFNKVLELFILRWQIKYISCLFHNFRHNISRNGVMKLINILNIEKTNKIVALIFMYTYNERLT